MAYPIIPCERVVRNVGFTAALNGKDLSKIDVKSFSKRMDVFGKDQKESIKKIAEAMSEACQPLQNGSRAPDKNTPFYQLAQMYLAGNKEEKTWLIDILLQMKEGKELNDIENTTKISGANILLKLDENKFKEAVKDLFPLTPPPAMSSSEPSPIAKKYESPPGSQQVSNTKKDPGQNEEKNKKIEFLQYQIANFQNAIKTVERIENAPKTKEHYKSLLKEYESDLKKLNDS